MSSAGNVKKPPSWQAGGLQEQSKDISSDYAGKSTAGDAQRDRIIKALLSGPKTSHDLRCLGCYQAPARVKELRDRFGYVIVTERVSLYDSYGYRHCNAARYRLVGWVE